MIHVLHTQDSDIHFTHGVVWHRHFWHYFLLKKWCLNHLWFVLFFTHFCLSASWTLPYDDWQKYGIFAREQPRGLWQPISGYVRIAWVCLGGGEMGWWFTLIDAWPSRNKIYPINTMCKQQRTWTLKHQMFNKWYTKCCRFLLCSLPPLPKWVNKESLFMLA